MASLSHSTSILRSSADPPFLPPSYATFPARFSYPPPPSARSCAIRSNPEMSSQIPAPTVSTVTISYTEIKDPTADILEKIELGFGPNGLGILSISDVPGYSLLRQNLLRLAPRLASLPEEVKRELEDPNSRYNIGWSHGKETFQSGKPDVLKGSFYANPILDIPTTEPSLVKRYPSYCGPNIWPCGALPDLELAFKALGKLILDVGLLLAYHCDRYVLPLKMVHLCHHGVGGIQIMVLSQDWLKVIILQSRWVTNQGLTCFHDRDVGEYYPWSLNVGLTCGMFTRDFVELACPDSAAGLYVKARSGEIVKVLFGEDEIAYQIGETTEILSRGQLCATPHCVQAPKGEAASSVERSTFALFMQPDWDEKLIFPGLVNIHEFITPNGSISFGDYTKKVLDKYYDING